MALNTVSHTRHLLFSSHQLRCLPIFAKDIRDRIGLPTIAHHGASSIFTQCSSRQCKEAPALKIQSDVITPVFCDVEKYRKRPALLTQDEEYLYEDIYMRSWELAKGLIGLLTNNISGDTNDGSSRQKRVCLLCDSLLSHVVMCWSCWLAGNTVVPLPHSASQGDLEYRIRQSSPAILLATKSMSDKANGVVKSIGKAGPQLVVLDESWWKGPEQVVDPEWKVPNQFADPAFYKTGDALVLFTEGRSAGKPRGVIFSHATLANQISRAVSAWEYSSQDSVLHSLEAQKSYGLVNSLLAPLSVGAQIHSVKQFDIPLIWSYLLGVGITSGNKYRKVTVFPGTPQIYQKLLMKGKDIFKDKKSREYAKTTCTKRLRLMTCSSTTLSNDLYQEWSKLTGHSILENYINTEAGTAFAYSRNKQSDIELKWRGVDSRLVLFRDHTKKTLDVLAQFDEFGHRVLVDNPDNLPVIGELLIRGEGMSRHYLEQGEEKEVCDGDSWLATGHILQIINGSYKLRGKLNIRSIRRPGNVFISAPEVEKKILSNPDLTDVYLLGLGDTGADQEIGLVMVLDKNRKITMENILSWCNNNLKPEQIPSVFKIVEKIPRNRNGHVDKFQIMALFNHVNVLCFYDSKL